MRVGVLARHLFHAILECKLALLQGDFFELFGGRKVVLVGEFVQAVVQLVVLFCELAILVVVSAATGFLRPVLPLRS